MEMSMSLKHFVKFSCLALSTVFVLTACDQEQSTENTDSQNPTTTEKQSAVTVGYQGIVNPWKAAIQSKAFTQATGRPINWRKFSSGSEVITAMASGDVQMAVAGSSPIATAMSRGLDVELVWILEAIENNEALVARKDSGIKTMEDLKGKTVGVPFASTTHYHLLFALDHHNVATKDLKILNLQPDAIAASWAQNRIDAAFVWSPVLDEIKKTGDVVITSGELAKLGRPTFDGIIAQKEFAKNNADFMAQFLATLAKADDEYRQNKDTLKPDSEWVKSISQFTGAKAEDVPHILSQYHFPDLQEQVSKTWLGSGKGEGAVQALTDTAAFLKAQKSIPDVLPDYSPYVNATYAQKALSFSTADSHKETEKVAHE